MTACACERNGEVTLPQLLHLQNGDMVARKVLSAECRLMSILDKEADDKKVLEELYLLTLCRLPTEKEKSIVHQVLTQSSGREGVFRDVLWALINTKEFAFNH